jgi:transcriptional regulator with XRE-family HTH domain
VNGTRSTAREWQQARLIGAAIRASRRRAGLTQIELAARLSESGHACQQGAVSRMELGKSRLMLSTFVNVIRAIGRDPGRVLSRALKAPKRDGAIGPEAPSA